MSVEDLVKSGSYSAANICLSTEQRPASAALKQIFLQRFNPIDGVEMEFVDEMVNARWRMKRIVTSETACIEHQLFINEPGVEENMPEATDAQKNCFAFDSMAQDGKTLPLLLRYQDCLRRTYNAAYKMLKDLQASRKTPPAPAEPKQEPKPQKMKEDKPFTAAESLYYPIGN